MKDYNKNTNPSLKQISAQQLTAKNTVEAIQNISKNIREYSFGMRDTMRTLRESGAIPEIAQAIREASLAVRDTAKDLNETTQDLKKDGVIVDTANAVENILKSTRESISTVKEITVDAEKVSPQTTKAVQEGIDRVKKETSQVTEKMMSGVKHVGLSA